MANRAGAKRFETADAKPFRTPATVDLGHGPVAVPSTLQASRLLMSVEWPGRRDASHAEAVETCLKVLDGHRSTEEARTVFTAAAAKAGVLIGR